MISRLVLILLAVSSASFAEMPNEKLETFRAYLASNNHVALVCFFDEHFEERPLPEKHLLYRTATVVRGIRGQWRIGDKIRFYSLLEAKPQNYKSTDGALAFVFLKNAPVGEVFLDTGDAWQYEPELDAILQNEKR